MNINSNFKLFSKNIAPISTFLQNVYLSQLRHPKVCKFQTAEISVFFFPKNVTVITKIAILLGMLNTRTQDFRYRGQVLNAVSHKKKFTTPTYQFRDMFRFQMQKYAEISAKKSCFSKNMFFLPEFDMKKTTCYFCLDLRYKKMKM